MIMITLNNSLGRSYMHTEWLPMQPFPPYLVEDGGWMALQNLDWNSFLVSYFILNTWFTS